MSAGSTVGVHKPSIWVSDKRRLTKRVLAKLAELFVREPDDTSLQLHLQTETKTENAATESSLNGLLLGFLELTHLLGLLSMTAFISTS